VKTYLWGSALVLLAVGLVVGGAVIGAADKEEKKEEKTNLKEKEVDGATLKWDDLKEGEGPAVKKGDTVEVHYTGWLLTDGKKGKKFDSSLDRKEPFSFTVGDRMVIRGWDEGLLGMKAGGKRMLYIPSKLGYGARGAGRDIPPNADLVFEIELLKIK
jgi:peptidylprolyl isomerase